MESEKYTEICADIRRGDAWDLLLIVMEKYLIYFDSSGISDDIIWNIGELFLLRDVFLKLKSIEYCANTGFLSASKAGEDASGAEEKRLYINKIIW